MFSCLKKAPFLWEDPGACWWRGLDPQAGSDRHSPVFVLYMSAGSYDSQDGNAVGPWNFHHPHTHLVIGKLITVAQLLCEQSALSVLILSPHSSSVMHHILFFSAPLPTVTDETRLCHWLQTSLQPLQNWKHIADYYV